MGRYLLVIGTHSLPDHVDVGGTVQPERLPSFFCRIDQVDTAHLHAIEHRSEKIARLRDTSESRGRHASFERFDIRGVGQADPDVHLLEPFSEIPRLLPKIPLVHVGVTRTDDLVGVEQNCNHAPRLLCFDCQRFHQRDCVLATGNQHHLTRLDGDGAGDDVMCQLIEVGRLRASRRGEEIRLAQHTKKKHPEKRGRIFHRRNSFRAVYGRTFLGFTRDGVILAYTPQGPRGQLSTSTPSTPGEFHGTNCQAEVDHQWLCSVEHPSLGFCSATLSKEFLAGASSVVREAIPSRNGGACFRTEKGFMRNQQNLVPGARHGPNVYRFVSSG